MRLEEVDTGLEVLELWEEVLDDVEALLEELDDPE